MNLWHNFNGLNIFLTIKTLILYYVTNTQILTMEHKDTTLSSNTDNVENSEIKGSSQKVDSKDAASVNSTVDKPQDLSANAGTEPRHEPYPDNVIEQDSEKVFSLLEDRIIEARHIIKRSPHLKQFGDTLYRVPWYLFLGNQQAAGKQLLQEANRNGPVASLYQQHDHPSLWTWWFLQSMIGIELDIDAIGSPNSALKREFWQKALYLLQKKRPKLPINGAVVLVDAQFLQSEESKIIDYGKSLRYMIDECHKNLYIEFPITILVTNCHSLKGFDNFFSKLTPTIHNQAFGHRFNLQSLEHDSYEKNVLDF